MTQRRRAPQPASCGRTEIESCGLRVPVVRRELLQFAPVAEPVVLQIGGHSGRPQQHSLMPSGPPPTLSITGELASAPNLSGRMRHFGASMTPFWWAYGRWHGKASPTSQSSSTGSCEPTTSWSVRSCGIRGGVRAIQCCGPGRRRWRPASLRRRCGNRGQRCPQVAQGRRRADVGEADAACGLAVVARHPRPRHRGRRPCGRSAPPGSRDRSRSLQSAGSRYHAEQEPQAAGCRSASCPSPACGPGSRVKGGRAPEPSTPARGVVPPSVSAWVVDSSPWGESAKLLDVPGPPITSSAERLLGMPFGPNPSLVAAPRASPARAPAGVSMPAWGFCSTIT